jgi:hypothetical protein
MTTTTVTTTARTVVASASNAAGATTRGTLDLRTKLGGLLTMKITNGGTGPTVQAEGRVLVAHNAGSTPTAGSAGTDWKTVWRFGGGTTANAVTEQSWEFGPAVMHLEVEFTGNTGQAVTVEAFVSEVTDAQTA